MLGALIGLVCGFLPFFGLFLGPIAAVMLLRTTSSLKSRVGAGLAVAGALTNVGVAMMLNLAGSS